MKAVSVAEQAAGADALRAPLSGKSLGVWPLSVERIDSDESSSKVYCRPARR